MTNIKNEGIVGWIGTNPWKDKVFMTFTLDGEEDMFYRLGEGTSATKNLKVGDQIKFEFYEKRRGKYVNLEVDLDTVEVSQGEAHVNPSTGKNNPPNPKDIRFAYAGASNRAIDFVNVGLTHGVFKLPKTKPQEAFWNLVLLYTEKFFQEVMREDNKEVLSSLDVEIVGQEKEEDDEYI